MAERRWHAVLRLSPGSIMGLLVWLPAGPKRAAVIHLDFSARRRTPTRDQTETSPTFLLLSEAAFKPSAEIKILTNSEWEKKKSLDANKSPGSPKSAQAAVKLTSITAAFSQCFAVFVQFGPGAGTVQDLDRSPLLEPVNVRRCWCFTEDCQNTDRLKPPRFPGSTI